MRSAMTAWIMVGLLLFGLGLGIARASDADEAAVTAQVTSSDHELEEGYFSLGDSATVIARPGTDLHRFLARQRGKKIRVVLSEVNTRELSQIRR